MKSGEWGRSEHLEGRKRVEKKVTIFKGKRVKEKTQR